MDKLNMAIIGHGFVGKAVDHGFTNNKVLPWIIDPNGGHSIEVLKDQSIDISFVCVPTPMGNDGSIDSSIVLEVMDYLIKNVTGLIVLKSTVVPNLVHEFYQMAPDRFVYNPEFLVERTANWDFVNPIMHVFGGDDQPCRDLHEIYDQYSNCVPGVTAKYMTAKEAAFVKYGINSFLATKVAWFNQYYDFVNALGANFEVVRDAIGFDSRVSSSHTRVPGPDGKRWFGGACFGKDTNAILKLALTEDINMSILQTAVKENGIGRSAYELDDREKEQKVNFNL